jgi:hypothetical protein
MNGHLLFTLAALAAGTGLFAQDATWKPIFDGKTLDGWKRMAGTAEYRKEVHTTGSQPFS